MQDRVNSLTIGGLAKTVNVNVETIRYYQRRGLLAKPIRPSGGISRYYEEDMARMRFIKTAKELGFNLDEIAELLRLDDGIHCNEASNLARHKLDDVRCKISNLRQIEKVLDELLTRCRIKAGNANCPLIHSLHEGLSELPHSRLPWES